MFNKLRNLFLGDQPVPQEMQQSEPPKEPKKRKQPRKPKEVKPPPTAKELATLAGEPYVAILRVEVDPANINAGSFELDWNDKFVVNLVKSGYKMRPDDTDQTVVDRWFQTVCRNIALEVYEQQEADPSKRDVDDTRRIQQKNLGNGRTEVS